MKKILLLSHSQKSGGAERCLLEAAVGLKNRGYHVTMFLPSDGEMNELLQKEAIPFKITPYPWWVHFGTHPLGLAGKIRKLASILKYSLRLRNEIKKLNPDFVISNTICNPCGALVCKWTGTRHSWFIHEFGKEDHNLVFDFGEKASAQFIDRTSDTVMVNSELVKAKFTKFIKGERFNVINYNIPEPVVPADVRRFHPSSFDLIIVGQVKETKGQFDAVKALSILLNKGYDCRLIIIGMVIDQPYYDEMVNMVKKENMQDRVRFISHAPYPYASLDRFTIGLMCSEFEALGRVTIEYMKAGIPVVGAKAGSTMRLIEHGKTGLLYELKNANDLAEKIVQLLSNEEKLKQITTSARKWAEDNFNEKKFTEGILHSIKIA